MTPSHGERLLDPDWNSTTLLWFIPLSPWKVVEKGLSDCALHHSSQSLWFWFCLLFTVVVCLFSVSQLTACQERLRHTQTCCLAAGEVSRSSSIGSCARMKKCDRCHYVWRLAWRGLALSPLWEARPVPKLASHKCESQADEGAEQGGSWGVRWAEEEALGRWEPASATAKQTEGQQAADQSLVCHRGDWLRCCAAESKLTAGRLCACVTL